MKLAVPKESHPQETRVAVSPETAKKFRALNLDVAVEGAGFADAAYEEAGARLAGGGAALVGMLSPYGGREAVEAYAAAGVDAFAMELVPRISRFVSPFVDGERGALAFDWNDELVTGTGLTRDGNVVHPSFLSTD